MPMKAPNSTSIFSFIVTAVTLEIKVSKITLPYSCHCEERGAPRSES
jgi:hypothetical protein